MTSDPVSYLRARYDEEESSVSLGYPDGWHTVRSGHDQIEFSADCTCDVPARRLLDIAAKREILDLYELSLAETRAERDWSFLEAPVPPMPIRTLRLGSTRGLELAVQALLAWLTPERRPNMATGQEILDRLKGDRS